MKKWNRWNFLNLLDLVVSEESGKYSCPKGHSIRNSDLYCSQCGSEIKFNIDDKDIGDRVLIACGELGLKRDHVNSDSIGELCHNIKNAGDVDSVIMAVDQYFGYDLGNHASGLKLSQAELWDIAHRLYKSGYDLDSISGMLESNLFNSFDYSRVMKMISSVMSEYKAVWAEDYISMLRGKIRVQHR